MKMLDMEKIELIIETLIHILMFFTLYVIALLFTWISACFMLVWSAYLFFDFSVMMGFMICFLIFFAGFYFIITFEYYLVNPKIHYWRSTSSIREVIIIFFTLIFSSLAVYHFEINHSYYPYTAKYDYLEADLAISILLSNAISLLGILIYKFLISIPDIRQSLSGRRSRIKKEKQKKRRKVEYLADMELKEVLKCRLPIIIHPRIKKRVKSLTKAIIEEQSKNAARAKKIRFLDRYNLPFESEYDEIPLNCLKKNLKYLYEQVGEEMFKHLHLLDLTKGEIRSKLPN